jgi:PAS domain S-box-containing protein
MRESLRKSGIDIIGDVPWGTHFCHFYQTKKDLVDVLVPYFKAGLENNEFCLWTVSQPSEVEEVKEALKRDIPDIDVYLEKGQIEIIPYSHGYVNEGVSDWEKISNTWVKKLNQALANGYEGLRLTGNTFWTEKKDTGHFAEYEEEIDNTICNYQMIALCAYSLDTCNVTRILDVAVNHQFVSIKREGEWEQIKSSRREKEEEKTKNLANIVESSNDAILIISLDGIITSWNKGAEQIYGYSAKEILGKPVSILEPAMLVEETEELIELIKQGDRIHHYETLRLRKDGTKVNVLVTLSPIIDSSERLTAISVIARNITEHKKIEEKLRKSEERHRIATEQTGQVVYEYDLRTDKSSWTGAIEEVTGYSPQEFKNFGKEVWIKNIHFADMNHGDEKFQNFKNTGSRFKKELMLRRKDGNCIYIENKGVWLTDNGGQPYGAIGVLKDITDTRTADIQLHESEERYRTAAEQTGQVVFDFRLETHTVELEGAIREVTGYDPEEFKNFDESVWIEYVHPEDRTGLLEKLKMLFRKEDKIRAECRFRKKDESYIYLEIRGVWIKNDEGKIYRAIGVMKDVTERRKTEEFLANIEATRLREIHHRIKNNLQVISSLIDLQAEKFRDGECIRNSEVLEAFRESQDRVMSMALIHEELHEGGEIDKLKFSSYLEKLAESLFQTYRLGNTDISLKMDIEEKISFDMDTAVPLGIIVNELVSNSFKHAFTGRDHGRIQIKLCREESREYKDNKVKGNNGNTQGTGFILIVSDDGISIPEGIDLENPDSLGIQLVTALVDQLEGELELKRDNGTEFIIRFTVA